MQSQISELGSKLASLTQTQRHIESATTANNRSQSLPPSEGAGMDIEQPKAQKRQAPKDQQEAQNPKKRIETDAASQPTSTSLLKPS